MFPHGAGPTGPLDFTQIAEMNLGNFKVSLCETLVRRICGGMTMPGLPKVPAAEKIDVDENGRITGLF